MSTVATRVQRLTNKQQITLVFAEDAVTMLQLPDDAADATALSIHLKRQHGLQPQPRVAGRPQFFLSEFLSAYEICETSCKSDGSSPTHVPTSYQPPPRRQNQKPKPAAVAPTPRPKPKAKLKSKTRPISSAQLVASRPALDLSGGDRLMTPMELATLLGLPKSNPSAYFAKLRGRGLRGHKYQTDNGVIGYRYSVAETRVMLANRKRVAAKAPPLHILPESEVEAALPPAVPAPTKEMEDASTLDAELVTITTIEPERASKLRELFTLSELIVRLRLNPRAKELFRHQLAICGTKWEDGHDEPAYVLEQAEQLVRSERAQYRASS